MATIKKLESVAHNIMDHAVSGLSCLFPHVFDRCAANDSKTFTIDLLEPANESEANGEPGPLDLASAAVRRRFVEILVKSRGDLRDVRSAHLEFTILGEQEQEWPRFSCQSVIVANTGRVFSRNMDSASYWDRTENNPLAEIQQKIRDAWGSGDSREPEG